MQILPEDAIKKTFKAGQDLYDESKLKSKGGKKREYSSQVIVSNHPSREKAEADCVHVLKQRLDSESTEKEAVVTSERVIVVDGVANEIIECQVTGFVWTKA